MSCRNLLNTCHGCTRQPARDPKRELLRADGAFNRRAAQVTDPLFLKEPFFDPRDLVQVKYEMLRRVEARGAQ